MASKLKKITSSIVVPLLLLTCYSVCYSQQVSRLVNYHADFKPFGEGIKKEYAFPNDVDPDKHFQIVFTFQLMPEQIEADVMGTIIFDQENGTIQIRGNDGSLQSKGGLELKGVVKIAFVIESIPILCDFPLTLTALCPITIALDHLVDTPLSITGEVTFLDASDITNEFFSKIVSSLLPIGSLTVNPYQTWDESEPFSTLLLNDDVAVTGGIRELVRAELSAVDVVQLIVAALTTIPPQVSKPFAKIIKLGIGDAAISANLGFLSTATLSGESITVNGVNITRENQTINAPGLDLSQDSYTVNSNYNEDFTYKVDFIASSDVTLEFNPLGIPIWDYKKVIGELPIVPIVSEQEVDLNFTPNRITFPIAQTSTVPAVQAPVPKGVIQERVFREGGSSQTVNVASYFSSENPLTYAAVSNPSGIVTTSVSGSRVTIRPRSAGATTVVVTARDTVNTNLTAIQAISIVVRQTSTGNGPPPRNTDPIFDMPDNTSSASTLGIGDYVIVGKVSNYLNVRSGPGSTDIGDVRNGDYGRITDGPLYASLDGTQYKWWEIDWDTQRLEGWVAEFTGGERRIFRYIPDLEIEDFNVRPSQITQGQRITLEVEVVNNGPGSSEAAEVVFYYHDGRDSNNTLEELYRDLGRRKEDFLSPGKINVAPMQEGITRRLDIDIDAPRAPGDYYFGAVLIYDFNNDTDSLGDPDKGLNDFEPEESLEVTWPPDYIIESVSVSKTILNPGERFTLRATVLNQGLGEATNRATLDYYRSSNARISEGDTKVGYDRVSILDTDETGNESISLNAPSDPGVYYFGACIEDVSNESRTNNNCSAAVAITVRAPDPNEPPAVPDLIIESPTASPSTLGPGESFTLNVTVRNKGTAASPATTFGWYRSPNANISMNDTEIESADISSLRAGRTVPQQISLIAPMAAGTYYYGGCVESVTDESDTTNNCSSAIEITVQNRAPTTVGTISEQTLSVGDTSMRLSVSPYFSDPNNASLTYTAISSDTSVVDTEAAGVSGSNLTIHPIAEGSATITVTASDGELTATQTFSVTVNPIIISESPDLVVSLSATENFLTPNSHFKLQATVRNQGNADTSDLITLRYFVSSDATISTDDDDVQISTASIGNLKIGIPEDEDYGLRASQNPGVYYYYACVDSVTGEENTDNNCSNLVAVNVLGSDLIVESVSVDLLGQTDGINPNGEFRLNATVRNQGTTDAAAATARFYISSDQTLSSDDSEVQTAGISAINTGALVNVKSATIQSPWTSGVFYCFVCVDDVTNETDTTNNCSDPIQITILSAETWMPDANLRAAIRSVLGLNAGDPLTQQNMAELTSLNADSKQIINLTGLEYATNLTRLIVPRNEIKGLTPIENLTTLTYIDLHYNQISDLTPLQNLISLTVLRIGANQMTNIMPLENLTALTELWIPYNDQISDFTPLRNLTALTKLILYQTQIKDLTPLENLTNLTELWLYDNGISDIEPLKNLTDLTSLQIQNNQISDVSSLEGLTALRILYISGNQITDYTPLRRLKTKNPNLSTDITIPADPANNAPVAVGTISAPTLTVGDSSTVLDVSGNFSDTDNDTLTYTATSSNTSVATVSMSNVQVTITPVAAGSATITITANDGSLTATQTISVNVAAADAADPTPIGNRAPVSVGTISAQPVIVGGSSVVLDVSSYFSDADNDTLTYTASSNNTSVVTVNVSGAQVTGTPLSAGSATISITASDGELTATQTLAISVTEYPSTSIIPDPNLATAVRETLSLGINDDITQVNIQRLTSLSALGRRITNLTGLEHATKLTTLDIGSNQISDVSPLIALTNLNRLFLGRNNISDVSALAALTNLEELSLHGNNISDVSALAALTNLEELSLHGNNISDVSALAALTNLEELYLYNNNISDVSPLAALTNLNILQLNDNQINALPIGMFNGFSNLRMLYLGTNPGSLFTLTLKLARTDNTDLKSPGPATVKVRVAEGAPFTMSVNLSIYGGTLSTTTATIAKGSTESDAITVTQTGTSVTTVSIGTAPSLPSPNYKGIQTAVGDSLILFSDVSQGNRSPFVVRTISAQTLFVGGPNATVNASSSFSDSDGDALTYTASSNNTAAATVSVSGSIVTITPKTAGRVTVNVTASDGSLTATLKFTVDVLSSIIPDPNLAAVVRNALGLGTNDDITQTNILGLTRLNAARHSNSPGAITNLTGLEHATNLTWLVLSRNAISDLSPLASLTNLTLLVLRDNDLSLSDLSPLASLTNLTSLDLLVNEISDVTPLKDLTNLTSLMLNDNEISDVTLLKDLTNLTTLGLGNNEISDVTPLKDLTNLTFLGLQHNKISDVTPLRDLINLTRLYLHDNEISDVTPLKGLINLTNYLHLHENQISDVSALAALTNLKSLSLSSNQISDVSPLASLTMLNSLGLGGNVITDISPLTTLTNLTGLTIHNNQIVALPIDMFKGFSNLATLWLNGNSGAPFTLKLKLVRTDNTDLTAASPATVNVKIAEGAPFDMSVSLSVTGGTLSETTATIAKGSTESSAITVTQSSTGPTTVTLGTAPTVPSGYSGIQTAVDNPIVLFSTSQTNRAPLAVGTISAQSLTVGGSSAVVDVSGKFSDPDNDTLTYTASSSRHKYSDSERVQCPSYNHTRGCGKFNNHSNRK